MDLGPEVGVGTGLDDEVLADAVDLLDGGVEQITLELRDGVLAEEVGEDRLSGAEIEGLMVDERPAVERGVQLLALFLDFDDLRH